MKRLISFFIIPVLWVFGSTAHGFTSGSLTYNILSEENKEIELASIPRNMSHLEVPATVVSSINGDAIKAIRWEIVEGDWNESGGTYTTATTNGQYRLRCYFKAEGNVAFKVVQNNENAGNYKIYVCLDNPAAIWTYEYVMTFPQEEAVYSFTISDNQEHYADFYSYESGWSVGLASISISTYKVVAIGEGACQNKSNLYSAIIPEGVRSIGREAFADCTALREVTLPSTLKAIGVMAFKDCAFTEITLPSGLNELGGGVFNNCHNLLSIEIPAGIQHVPPSLFVGCDGLRSVSLPQNTTIIGEACFTSCETLAEVRLPSTVTTLGAWSFKCCKSLREFTIPENVEEVGTSTLMYCSSLERLNYNARNCKKFGDSLFPVVEVCDNLRTLTIGKEVAALPDSAFASCTSLREIYVFAETPPVGLSSVFAGVDKHECRLYVPEGHEDVFSASGAFSGFSVESFDPAGIGDVIADTPVCGIFRVYSLSGMHMLDTPDPDRLRRLPDGVYIINGKKVIIRN